PTRCSTCGSGGWRHQWAAAICLMANRRSSDRRGVPEDTPPAATMRAPEDTQPHRHLRPAGFLSPVSTEPGPRGFNGLWKLMDVQMKDLVIDDSMNLDESMKRMDL
ncbi:Os07g0621400, partial [Oryza sativa Japonica Group]